ncbi:glycosyltransferase family 2 protein [Candidatus Dependentiae bacterium]|nr:glycosyltransferase family 2 protein [Candidatus Dependentiae bacterium]
MMNLIKPNLCIIIVNWNSQAQLYKCLLSIKSADKTNLSLKNIIVVDNNSRDKSLEKIDELALNIKLIKNKKNVGFAKACNQAVQYSKAEYLLFLNPDVILENNSLTVPIEFMENEKNKKIGIVGVKLFDESGKVSRNCARFPNSSRFIEMALNLHKFFPQKIKGHFMLEWEHDEDRLVDQVMGAFLLIRAEIFKQLNGFDERFFLYFEDVDLSYRANLSGYKSMYISKAKVFHKAGGTSDQVKGKRLFYVLQSRILYYFKYFSFFVSIVNLISIITIEFFTRIIFLSIKSGFKGFIEVLKGYTLFYLNLNDTIRRMRKHE